MSEEISRREWLKRVGGTALGSFAFMSCSPDISREINELPERFTDRYEKISDIGCIGCENCMPCPYGLDIPANMLFVDEARRKGYLPGRISDKDFALKGKKFLTIFEAQIPDRMQSQKCIRCGECLGTCPVDIEIPDRMSQITALTDILRNLRCSDEL